MLAYLVDFLLCAPSREEVERDAQVLLSSLSGLGFSVNQVLSPTQTIEYLGLEINSVYFQAFLSQDRVEKFHQHLVKMDASLTGWGAVLKGRSVNGTWHLRLHYAHINYLELLEHFFLPLLRSCHVLVRADNTTVVAYMNQQGGMCSITQTGPESDNVEQRAPTVITCPPSASTWCGRHWG